VTDQSEARACRWSGLAYSSFCGRQSPRRHDDRKEQWLLLTKSALAWDLLPGGMVPSDRKSGVFRRVDWFRRWQVAASEVARQLEAERWSWARSWGLRRATEAIMLFGCDLRHDAPRMRGGRGEHRK